MIYYGTIEVDDILSKDDKNMKPQHTIHNIERNRMSHIVFTSSTTSTTPKGCEFATLTILLCK